MVLVGASSAPFLSPARVGGAHGPPIRRRGGRLVSPRAGRHPELQAAAHFGPPVLAPATGVAHVKAGARGFRSRLLGLEVRLKAALDDPALQSAETGPLSPDHAEACFGALAELTHAVSPELQPMLSLISRELRRAVFSGTSRLEMIPYFVLAARADAARDTATAALAACRAEVSRLRAERVVVPWPSIQLGRVAVDSQLANKNAGSANKNAGSIAGAVESAACAMRFAACPRPAGAVLERSAPSARRTRRRRGGSHVRSSPAAGRVVCT